jgi:putative hydrolase of the HAD superfamily
MAVPINAVVFDYGNVLNEPPEAVQYQPLARLADINEVEFLDLYWRNRLEYDRGIHLDGPAYWRRLARAAGKRLSAEQISQLIDLDAKLWVETRPILIEWVRILRKQGLETAILSNMPREIAAHLRRSAAWLGLFHQLVFSGEHGLVKPEAALYRVCLKGLTAQAGEVLFVDDREDNVEGAREAGMRAVKFESIPQLMRDVEPYGLRPSLEEASRTAAIRPVQAGITSSTQQGRGA